MTGFLDIPLELRNHIYELLLQDPVEPRFRGVLAVSDVYVKEQLPLRCYRGLLRTCRQTRLEFKQAIQHLAAAKQLNYELDITFSHGRPYFSLTWIRYPALSTTINTMVINVDLRVREPRNDMFSDHVPFDDELDDLLEDARSSFAKQLFDYIAFLLKALASLLSSGDVSFRVLFVEAIVLNLRTPTTLVPSLAHSNTHMRRVLVERAETQRIHDTMQRTLKANVNAFGAFDAIQCGTLSPLIQIGSLRFATEGTLWGEGNNLILAHDDFQWLRYPS